MENCKIKIEPFNLWEHHYFGWKTTIKFLRDKIFSYASDAVLFEPAVEATFVNIHTRDTERIKLYQENKWVAVFHHAHNDWRSWHHIYDLVNKNSEFQKALQNLVGIFVLCEEQRIAYSEIPELANIPISKLYHPTDVNVSKFDFELFSCKHPTKLPCGNLMMIGDHLRLHKKFSRFRTHYTKSVLLATEDDWAGRATRRDWWFANHNITKHTERISNQEYDKIMCQNIQFVELVNPTASNLLLECIARSTPVCINPHPSVVEYLGKDYPLYYTNIRKFARKLKQGGLPLLKDAHEYLKETLAQDKISPDYFVNSFFESDVYKSI